MGDFKDIKGTQGEKLAGACPDAFMISNELQATIAIFGSVEEPSGLIPSNRIFGIPIRCVRRMERLKAYVQCPSVRV